MYQYLKLRFTRLLSDSTRITTSGDWVPEVDGIRFVAILLVLVQHTHERVLRRTIGIYPEMKESVLNTVLTAGGVGVLIFFTLSGYILGKILITRLTDRKPLDLKAFYYRRLTRLEPPYLIVMTSLFLLLAVSGYRSSFSRSFDQGAKSLTDAWTASICYSYTTIYGTLPKLNPPAWSLETEVQFYVIAPLFAWLVSQIPKGSIRFCVLVLSAILSAIFLSPIASENPHLRYSLLKFFPYFLGGFAVLEIPDYFRSAKRSGIFWDGLAVGAFIALLSEKFWIPETFRTAVTTAAAFLFVAGSLNGVVIRQFLRIRLVAVIGGMCYSIYLIHLPILEAGAGISTKLGRGLPYPLFLSLQFVILMAAVLPISWIFFRLIERPCMERNWPSTVWQRIKKTFSKKV